MKIYIIAHTWRDTDMTIEHFWTAEKCVRRLSELVSTTGFRKAFPVDDPQEYLEEYYEYIEDERDNQTDVVIALEILQPSMSY